MLTDLTELLHTAAYHPQEIERVLDPAHPCFVQFDPELGYELRDYDFHDGTGGILSDYVYEPHGGHRRVVNYADRPCRINTYGDSFTQCAQVSNGETWQEVLAAHFHEPVRNFGVGGYGVHQSCLRARRVEPTDLGGQYIVLNIWDDDHKRNLDAARWIRVAWMCRDLPRGGADTYPVHGFPWGHVRYDLERGDFVERPGRCRVAEDLRDLVGKDAFHAAFRDDHVAHLYALTQGGAAPVDHLERIAEALGVAVDLRSTDRARRAAEADRLHLAYALRSTMSVLDRFRTWVTGQGRHLLVLLSYDVPTVSDFLADGRRWDGPILEHLQEGGYRYVDCLQKAADEYRVFNLSIDDFIARHYVGRAGAQVFGHYSPHGNFWFACAIKDELVKWLDPPPPSYR